MANIGNSWDKFFEEETQKAYYLKLKEFLIDNHDNHIEDPKAISKYENKLAKLQRQIAKKKKGSKKYKKR